MARKKSLSVAFPRKEDLLDHFKWAEQKGVMFIETDQKLNLGESVILEVEFPAESRSFNLHGTVITRRLATSGLPALKAGVEIEFPAVQSRTLQLVLDHVHGKHVSFVQRRSKRTECSFEVSYRRDADFIREFALDISEGGTFIRSQKVLAPGTEVECRLKPPGYLMGIKLKGSVRWARHQRQPTGMGIAFHFDNERQHKKFRTLVQKLSRDKQGKLYRTAPEHKLANSEPEESRRQWAEANVEKAEAAIEAKRFQDAIDWYQEAIRVYPNDPSFHHRLGVASYLKAQDLTPSDQPLPPAIQKPFLKALALNPALDEPRVYLGYIAVRNGELHRALKEFTGALECNPQNQVARTEANVLYKRLQARSKKK